MEGVLGQRFVSFAIFRGFRVPMSFRADGGVNGLIIIPLSSRLMNENIAQKQMVSIRNFFLITNIFRLNATDLNFHCPIDQEIST